MPVFCALDRIRTYDLLLRRQTLYPLSYEGSQGSCRYRRDVLELSRKVASNGKSAPICGAQQCRVLLKQALNAWSVREWPAAPAAQQRPPASQAPPRNLRSRQ